MIPAAHGNNWKNVTAATLCFWIALDTGRKQPQLDLPQLRLKEYYFDAACGLSCT